MDSKDDQKLCSSLDTHTSAICALVEAMGMRAENDIRKSNGEALAYGESSFIHVLERHKLQGF